MKMSATVGGAHESQALRPVSLYAARFGGSLRSPSRTLRVREMRPRASRAQRARPARDPKETEMLTKPQHVRPSAAKRCAICDGKFGLIRHYSWRTALCSRKCVN